jgi:nicotinamide mononucleotide transporter
MIVIDWISGNYIEVFGAVTGILYVFLEIRQNLWLWPVGIMTSAVYIWVFFTGKLYADMGLQGYYLIISVIGWYWWVKGSRVLRSYSEGGGRRAQGSGGEKVKERKGEMEIPDADSPFEEPVPPKREGQEDVFINSNNMLFVSHIKVKTGIVLLVIFVLLYIGMWSFLDHLTDSPVPGWDSFITSLSIIATWMLARKIYEHWYLWIIVNGVAVILFLSRGLYPTVVLYAVYFAMSFIGLKEWRKTIPHPPAPSPAGEGE